MASVLRGLGKTVLGAGAFYFLVMRNLDSVADYCNERSDMGGSKCAMLHNQLCAA
jgi:hypothetical protein